jgi:hypothetical protein
VSVTLWWSHVRDIARSNPDREGRRAPAAYTLLSPLLRSRQAMNILPDDYPLATALRRELEDKGGGIHLEMGRLVPSENSPPDPLLGEHGFRPAPDWTPLSPGEALACVVGLLARKLPPGEPTIPRAEAEALAARFGALVSERAAFYSFDSGVLVVDGDRIGRLWVEDEY